MRPAKDKIKTTQGVLNELEIVRMLNLLKADNQTKKNNLNQNGKFEYRGLFLVKLFRKKAESSGVRRSD
jgi:hypothetical protein